MLCIVIYSVERVSFCGACGLRKPNPENTQGFLQNFRTRLTLLGLPRRLGPRQPYTLKPKCCILNPENLKPP